MRYMGSKRRIAKYILPIILKDRRPDQWYIEPFVGGGNIFDLVENPRIGSDAFFPAIFALITIRDLLYIIPKCKNCLSEEDYKLIINDPRHPLHGYVSFACSFGGKYRGGYMCDSTGKRDYINESYRNACAQSLRLQGSNLRNYDYDCLIMPANSIIYCDPPYENTTGYKTPFNHREFWQWCRVMSLRGHKVFISEYNAPDDFKCVWSKEQVTKINTSSTKKVVEKLFIYNI